MGELACDKREKPVPRQDLFRNGCKRQRRIIVERKFLYKNEYKDIQPYEDPVHNSFAAPSGIVITNRYH